MEHFHEYVFHHLKSTGLSISLFNETIEITLPSLLKAEKCKGKDWSFMGLLWRCWNHGVWREKHGSWALGLLCDSGYMTVPWQRQNFWVHWAGAVSCILSFMHYTHPRKCFWEKFWDWSVPLVSISSYAWKSGKILDSLWNFKVKMMEKWHHHSSFPEVLSCLCDTSVDLKHFFLTLLLLAGFVTCCVDNARTGR